MNSLRKMQISEQNQKINKVTVEFRIAGIVQGVGFRPAVFRIAAANKIAGWVRNDGGGVEILAYGLEKDIVQFENSILSEIPFPARIDNLEKISREFTLNYTDFQIIESSSGELTAMISPDLATCSDCLKEISDPLNRRYLYPFTNCTNCGPRFSIITALPYDRRNTTMSHFKMCSDCEAEYNNPLDRRFHAQPNACPRCGPSVKLLDKSGNTISESEEALIKLAELIKNGCIVAIKGIGGFQLICSAVDEKAVEKLRQRKNRIRKPFAIMINDLSEINDFCEISDIEKSLIKSPRAPIVLLEKKSSCQQASFMNLVAPGISTLGVMLPYSPLHHILMKYLGIPVIATSGNQSDEPICTDESAALTKLSEIADCFLVHNRPIARSLDDSIVRVISGKPCVFRSARGYSPQTIKLDRSMEEVLAYGAHQKNTFAFSRGNLIQFSQHIGDLDNCDTEQSLISNISDQQKIWNFKPEVVISDMHPMYFTSSLVERSNLKKLKVQHHIAHVLAVALEKGVKSQFLGVSWDGTGFGPDNKIWGGEFFVVDGKKITRFAHFREFPLPGAEAAIKNPWRTAVSLLSECGFNTLSHFSSSSLPLLNKIPSSDIRMILNIVKKRINSPMTTSAGRLFDAVAALTGICLKNTYDGEAPAMLESIARQTAECASIDRRELEEPYVDFSISSSLQYLSSRCYSFNYHSDLKSRSIIIDWMDLISDIISDLNSGKVSAGEISVKFHNCLVQLLKDITMFSGLNKVILSGGCFQNRFLSELAETQLSSSGIQVFRSENIPSGDGGICAGQIAWYNNS
ncbi:MAG: carbamoyltransferase HypF [Candidatus Riflebacteria bacterium]|nr:carbamoyltransferase HypF [Candidatus Riflebacteria bacterium]